MVQRLSTVNCLFVFITRTSIDKIILSILLLNDTFKEVYLYVGCLSARFRPIVIDLLLLLRNHFVLVMIVSILLRGVCGHIIIIIVTMICRRRIKKFLTLYISELSF